MLVRPPVTLPGAPGFSVMAAWLEPGASLVLVPVSLSTPNTHVLFCLTPKNSPYPSSLQLLSHQAWQGHTSAHPTAPHRNTFCHICLSMTLIQTYTQQNLKLCHHPHLWQRNFKFPKQSVCISISNVRKYLLPFTLLSASLFCVLFHRTQMVGKDLKLV